MSNAQALDVPAHACERTSTRMESSEATGCSSLRQSVPTSLSKCSLSMRKSTSPPPTVAGEHTYKGLRPLLGGDYSGLSSEGLHIEG